MNDNAPSDGKAPLRTGFTTGACATAASAAAVGRLLNGAWQDQITITLPKGQSVTFELSHQETGPDWAEAGVIKDAGDDPDVTHGALIRVRARATGKGITFAAGDGVGTVTKPGLPVAVGEPAINPVPRQMMTKAVTLIADARGVPANFELTVSVPNGAAIAEKTWNPRLGIVGGISILGTTGIVRPFSCAAWIASIHRGVDVARALGEPHVCGATGNTSEATAQSTLNLPDHAMLDMGDFAGGMLKYLSRHPVPRVTIAGGFGKITKLAQGAVDLHSRRSQVNFDTLAAWANIPAISTANTAAEALAIAGSPLAQIVADRAAVSARKILKNNDISLDVMIVDRDGTLLATSGPESP